jgi:predicted amidophosphoribosyltransferase
MAAVIECPYCARNIDEKSKTCPLCGLDIPHAGSDPEAVSQKQATAIPAQPVAQAQTVIVNAPADEVDCPFCAEKIKRKAVKCKHCGSDLRAPAAPVPNHVVQAQPVQQNPQHVQTIEQTSKKWKGMLVFGVVLMMVGFIMVLTGVFALGGISLLVGVCATVYAKIMSWWHHG